MIEQTHKEKESVKDRILARIEGGELTVRPRALLILKAAALALIVFLALSISVFLFNFLFFFVRINFLEGPLGIAPLLMLFPWSLLAIDIGLVILAEVLLRQFRFAYRRPVLYTLFALFALAVSLGLFIDRATHFNDSMYDRAHRGRLFSPIGDMYRHARQF